MSASILGDNIFESLNIEIINKFHEYSLPDWNRKR